MLTSICFTSRKSS